ERTHRCPQCGLIMDRDENAALNILALGINGLGENP
ncbi:transposase, partial [Candidatus Pacearchaeota archaeon]|nr:transposase [Candidatus Pacearchaeota archaeon]